MLFLLCHVCNIHLYGSYINLIRFTQFSKWFVTSSDHTDLHKLNRKVIMGISHLKISAYRGNMEARFKCGSIPLKQRKKPEGLKFIFASGDRFSQTKLSRRNTTEIKGKQLFCQETPPKVNLFGSVLCPKINCHKDWIIQASCTVITTIYGHIDRNRKIDTKNDSESIGVIIIWSILLLLGIAKSTRYNI